MRFLYSFLLYLIAPVLFIRLWWRSRRAPAYRQRMAERIGFYPFTLPECVWVHAVSVGETLAAQPLIKALKARYPSIPLLVTTTTPTGAARVQAAFGDTVKHVYLPYDFPDAMTRFLNAMNPRVGVIMETELWPNLIAACQKKKVPLYLVNARLSGKSAKGYRRIAGMTRDMLQGLTGIASQGVADAERLIALGAPKERMMVTGNIKFDIQLPTDLTARAQALREELIEDRFIWIAASTHEGEEEIILAAHKKIREKNPQVLLILVPRHPERFDAIAALCEKSFITKRRSKGERCDLNTGVYLGDTMGELLLLYGAADIAFVAGSLVERGGHNFLEPAALGKPILTGPSLFNFAEISDMFFKADALIKVHDANELAEQVIRLQDKAQCAELSQRIAKVMDANRGALQKQVEMIAKFA